MTLKTLGGACSIVVVPFGSRKRHWPSGAGFRIKLLVVLNAVIKTSMHNGLPPSRVALA